MKSQRYRLCVFRSSKHIYAQIIDDSRGMTLCAASSLKLRDYPENLNGLSRKLYRASQVGMEIAERAKKLGIKDVYFDRNGYKYHGRVKQLAESARLGGLNF
ncbi:MAG: 50S ribosomal protein L18 [Chloracidobacterium sp.]|nr:50S ribosomal protein L18 [Chloracidobacterium sp.]MDW8217310.1 50S ribosomal protein L18 [Acidobacteriota bacterium]